MHLHKQIVPNLTFKSWLGMYLSWNYARNIISEMQKKYLMLRATSIAQIALFRAFIEQRAIYIFKKGI